MHLMSRDVLRISRSEICIVRSNRRKTLFASLGVTLWSALGTGRIGTGLPVGVRSFFPVGLRLDEVVRRWKLTHVVAFELERGELEQTLSPTLAETELTVVHVCFGLVNYRFELVHSLYALRAHGLHKVSLAHDLAVPEENAARATRVDLQVFEAD